MPWHVAAAMKLVERQIHNLKGHAVWEYAMRARWVGCVGGGGAKGLCDVPAG